MTEIQAYSNAIMTGRNQLMTCQATALGTVRLLCTSLL